jgi:hypothetical protein
MIDKYFDEVLYDLAFREKPPFLSMTLGPYYDDAGNEMIPFSPVLNPIYPFPHDAIHIKAIGIYGMLEITDLNEPFKFFSNFLLKKSTIEEIEAYSKEWRDTYSGYVCPQFYTEDDQAPRTFRVWPTPNYAPLIGGSGGVLYGVLVFADNRTGAIPYVPYWGALILSHDIIHREFSRPSNHRDLDYAEKVKDFTQLLYDIVGY